MSRAMTATVSEKQLKKMPVTNPPDTQLFIVCFLDDFYLCIFAWSSYCVPCKYLRRNLFIYLFIRSIDWSIDWLTDWLKKELKKESQLFFSASTSGINILLHYKCNIKKSKKTMILIEQYLNVTFYLVV